MNGLASGSDDRNQYQHKHLFRSELEGDWDPKPRNRKYHPSPDCSVAGQLQFDDEELHFPSVVGKQSRYSSDARVQLHSSSAGLE